jgi:hypothetical protein
MENFRGRIRKTWSRLRGGRRALATWIPGADAPYTAADMRHRSNRAAARLFCQTALFVAGAIPLGFPAAFAAQWFAAETAHSASVAAVASFSASAETERLAAELLDSFGSKNPIVGPTDTGQMTKAIASMLVRDLDPKNPSWNLSHPKWR